jgi:hypothetical protein
VSSGAVLVVAAASSGSTIAGIAIGGVFTVLAAVAAGLFALRGSSRNTDVEREKAFDARVDAENASLRAENDLLRKQVWWARYTLAAHNIDPSVLDTPGVASGRHRAA